MDKTARCAFNSRVVVRSGYEHCRVLVEDIGPRPAGEPAEEKAARYIASELRHSGLSAVRLEPFSCRCMEAVACRLRAVEPDLGEIAASPGIYSGSTPKGGITAELIAFDSERDIPWSSRRLRGKAVLAYGGFSSGARDLARRAGVSCLISVNDRPGPIFHLDGWPRAETLPHLHIGYWDAVRLLKERCRRLHLDCQVRIREKVSHNVVGLIEGRESGAHTLSLSAHYDTVPGTPGAGDNAAGVAVVLAAADALRRHPPRGDVRVVLFGAEELGLVGARAYARAHRAWFRDMRLGVYFDGMGDLVGRNKVQANGYRDLLEWSMNVAEACAYRCDAEDILCLLDNAWLNYYGVPTIRPWRKPQLHWHGAPDDMSVIGEQVLLDNARYAVELLHRASAPDRPPFTPGLPPPVLRRVRDYLDLDPRWGFREQRRASSRADS